MKVVVHTPISVTMSDYDWAELVNFVRGDLQNMQDGNDVKTHMANICDKIQTARAKKKTK